MSDNVEIPEGYDLKRILERLLSELWKANSGINQAAHSKNNRCWKKIDPFPSFISS